jgi:GntR family transcriptional regulator / MocR family aminotransferase
MHIDGIVLDRTSQAPLHRQLEGKLREAILSGALKAGEKIVASRELADHLGLSRNTVLAAIAQLHAEGYLVSVPGSGTFVSEVLPGRLKPDPLKRPTEDLTPTDHAALFIENAPLAGHFRRGVPFRPGLPALELFPGALFKRSFSAADWGADAMDYPDPLGDLHLREQIAKRLFQTRGIVCDIDQVAIAGGTQAAFTLISQVLVVRDDVMVVEDPGYPGVRAAFAAGGARLWYARVDEFGIEVESFSGKHAKLVHVTPSHQYPTGAVLSLERRLALLRWAAKHGAWIVEDDYDSEYNYTGRVQPALRSLDDGHRVIYLGTFSKVLSPALRVSYMIVPHDLLRAFTAALTVIGGQPSVFVQRALARFIAQGHFGRYIIKMRRVYDERRRFVSAELKRTLGIEILDSQAGLHFIAQLPSNVIDSHISARAAAQGLIIPALSHYSHLSPRRNGLVIGYAASPIPAAKSAIRTLATLFESPGNPQ